MCVFPHRQLAFHGYLAVHRWGHQSLKGVCACLLYVWFKELLKNAGLLWTPAKSECAFGQVLPDLQSVPNLFRFVTSRPASYFTGSSALERNYTRPVLSVSLLLSRMSSVWYMCNPIYSLVTNTFILLTKGCGGGRAWTCTHRQLYSWIFLYAVLTSMQLLPPYNLRLTNSATPPFIFKRTFFKQGPDRETVGPF